MIPLTSGGGGAAGLTHYSVNFSVGQTVIGDSNFLNYSTNLGFWQTFMNLLHQWLPLILK
jgi:hypothetical protein